MVTHLRTVGSSQMVTQPRRPLPLHMFQPIEWAPLPNSAGWKNSSTWSLGFFPRRWPNSGRNTCPKPRGSVGCVVLTCFSLSLCMQRCKVVRRDYSLEALCSRWRTWPVRPLCVASPSPVLEKPHFSAAGLWSLFWSSLFFFSCQVRISAVFNDFGKIFYLLIKKKNSAHWGTCKCATNSQRLLSICSLGTEQVRRNSNTMTNTYEKIPKIT